MAGGRMRAVSAQVVKDAAHQFEKGIEAFLKMAQPLVREALEPPQFANLFL